MIIITIVIIHQCAATLCQLIELRGFAQSSFKFWGQFICG